MSRFIFAALCGVFFSLSPSQAASIAITEFMAENDGFLKDSDGDAPDWLELRNNTGAAINLAGWHLTDDATNLTKWTFPATNISAGGYLIVFASGKNRAVAGAELHTSFQLDNSGGYLAIVGTNNAIVDAISYPAQRANVSFGVGDSNTVATLVLSNATTRWLIPADTTLGSSWTTNNFNDGAWNFAVAPLRYEVIPPGVATPVLSLDFNARGANDTAANTEPGFSSFTMSTASGIQSGAVVRAYGGISVTLSNSSSFGYDDRLRATPVNSGSFTLQSIFRDFIFSQERTNVSGLDVFVAGLAANQLYEITVWSFDTGSGGTRVSDWFANGVLVTNNYTFDGRVLPTDNSAYRFTFRTTATVSGDILISGRRDATSIDTANAASFGVFLNALQLSSVNATPTTNGNVAALAGQNASLYSRTPFVVSNPALYESLTLRMRYDDGFIAYVNGVEVARRNAPASASFNSAATATNSTPVFEEIILPGAASLLAGGTNVLAIQGLNVSASDSDFFLQPELLGVRSAALDTRFFSPATPGTANGAGFIGLVEDTKFSVDRGFFDTPFSLSITCATVGAQIRYTTNGSAPSLTNGFVFSSPINITANSFIRAAAFLASHVPSDIDTHSYIFLRDVLRQSNNIPNYPTVWQASYPADYGMDSNIVNHPVYGATISNDLRSIPSLMIVSDHNGLWNATSGIYPNSTSIGTNWDRAASLELIDGSGHTEFALTAKIAMHGNASRDNVRTPKHSMHASFNSDYGPTKLRYDWFGGGITVHDGIVFRSCGFVDGWAGRYADNTIYTSAETGEQFRGLRYRPENTCYLRDVWVKESFRDMGWLASRSAYVHLYINGLYWGLYQPSERVNASYFTLHEGGQEGAWDVVVGEDNNGPPVLVDGSLTDWNSLLALANAGVTTEAAYAAITNRIDIDNLIDYMMVHILAESEDWPRHNWYVAHRRATNGVPGTKFICTVWDQELTLDRLVRDASRNRINSGSTGGEVYSPARIYSQLRAWPEFRVRFGDRVQKHLFNGGALTPSNNVARLLGPAAIIRNALVGESARWGDARKTGVPAGQIGTGQTFTRDEWWQPEIDKLATNFLPRLTADNVARFRSGNLYPLIGAPNFNQFGGSVSNGFNLAIAHTNASSVIYFTTDGSDPRVYGSGAVAASALSFSVATPINAPTFIRSRVLSGTNWSALVEAVFYPPQDLSRLALTEIMYHPSGLLSTNDSESEFLELKNTGTNTLNLTGLTFSDGITFTFTNGTLLAPGQFFVLVRNTNAFASKYPGVAINGVYTGQFANNGETLTLSHPNGGMVFSVTYQDVAPWPVTPDGQGFSLVPLSPGLTQAADDGQKWRASTFIGGSPGTDDPLPSVAPIVVNEILTHTDLPVLDKIELFNPTGTNVNIGGWFLTDNPDVPKKFRITNGTIISARGFVAFDESQFNATPGTNNSFSLNSSGDQVYLFSGDANTNLTGYSHGFEFGAAANGVSFGRYIDSVGEEQFPAQTANSFGATNSGPRVGPVVINEIHYNPAPSGDEFIELKNITGSAVPLFDPVRPTIRWRLDGLGYTFPTNVTLDANAFLLIVATNPANFRAKYSIPANVLVLGPYSGALQDSGERLELKRPDAPDTNGTPYITVDEVRYNDRAPWPAAADGSGPSLQRTVASQYGDDPINWQAATPTPGFAGEADSDGDGLPDSWELANGTNPNLSDANADPDGDGLSNLQEFLAGTNPQSAQSGLRIGSTKVESNSMTFEFTAVSNRSYGVLFRPLLNSSNWQTLTNLPSAPTTRVERIRDALANTNRFYRVVTPVP